MFSKESVPFAPSLIESMRSLGYSFQSAISDIIDNSISANATRIDIIYIPSNVNPHIIIVDNGNGMTSEELEEAMRYGCKNPLEERDENDLGRFGLGMKSASLSQCRKLTVVSKKNNYRSCYSWDMDYVIKKQSWLMLGYGNDEINELPSINILDKLKSGTYVLLQNFDRVAESTNNLEATLNKSINDTIDHISLVFHRYLEEGIDIYVNNEKICPKDPFITSHKKTQFKRTQSFTINDSIITVKPFILPHINELTLEDIKKVGSKDRLRNEQGFYVYRNKRLIIWGTWFRLERKDELSKLARVMVDIPNSLDYMWNIDIKKSSANLPDIIKKNLYNCVYESILNSEQVHNYRGRKINVDEGIDYVWERFKTRDGYTYTINRNLPQIKLLEQTMDQDQLKIFGNLIGFIEDTFPVATLYIDAAKGHVKNNSDDEEYEKLHDQLMEQINFAKRKNMDWHSILIGFAKTEPFCNNKDIVKKIEEMLEDECIEFAVS